MNTSLLTHLGNSKLFSTSVAIHNYYMNEFVQLLIEPHHTEKRLIINIIELGNTIESNYSLIFKGIQSAPIAYSSSFSMLELTLKKILENSVVFVSSMAILSEFS